MLRTLSISAKVFFVLAQSNTIKRTLVHLMTKYEEVDDKLLAQMSQPGTGTTFVITLPVSSTPMAA